MLEIYKNKSKSYSLSINDNAFSQTQHRCLNCVSVTAQHRKILSSFICKLSKNEASVHKIPVILFSVNEEAPLDNKMPKNPLKMTNFAFIALLHPIREELFALPLGLFCAFFNFNTYNYFPFCLCDFLQFFIRSYAQFLPNILEFFDWCKNHGS